MKLRILLNLGSGWPEFKEDQVVEVPTDLTELEAQRLMRAGLAVEFHDEPARETIQGSQPESQHEAPTRVQQVRKTQPRFQAPPAPAKVESESEEKKD